MWLQPHISSTPRWRVVCIHGTHTIGTACANRRYAYSPPLLGIMRSPCAFLRDRNATLRSRQNTLCVFVCVSVLSVYFRSASYVGRPICVCAVSAPLWRVHTYMYERARGEGCRHGTHTNGTAYTHTRHLLESTHTNTHKHKQTHNVARQSTVRTHAVAAPSLLINHRGGRLAPTPSKLAASLSRSPTPKLCAPPPTGAVLAARATSTPTSLIHICACVQRACVLYVN